MEPVYVISGRRTPIVLRRGRFQRIRPEHFGAEVLKSLLRAYGLRQVDGILAGNAVGTGGNLARLMSLSAGIPEAVPACTIDMQCASAAAAVSLAAAKIASGCGDLYLAGGMESASLQPLRVYAAGDDRREMVPDGRYYTAQFAPGDLLPDTMLRGAERVCRAQHVERAELDAWVLRSHARAAAAARQGLMDDIIVPIDGWCRDDGIRPRMSQKLLDRLPTLFGSGSVTNAGNACRINDGAAFVALASEHYMKQHGLRAAAKIIDTLALGGDPQESPRGAMRAADALLSRHGLRYEDLAAIEFNEAFAVIDVLFARAHPSLCDRYLRFGGALAYGHPYGASGAILLLHLIKSLQAAGGGLGILSIAGAGGMGEAILLEMEA